MARFGRIDVLVNNVGKSEPAIPGEMDEALWDSQLAVNLKSAFLCCQAVLPIMQKQGKGAVVSRPARSAPQAGRGRKLRAEDGDRRVAMRSRDHPHRSSDP